LSEYGCKKNTRTFNAVSALYDTSKMTPVYSGGLVYEYSEESDNKGFGLVNIKSSTEVEDKDDFTALKKALDATPAPTGDGGYKTDGSPSKCPTKSSTWDVDLDDDVLPAMPDVAEYMKNGAGKAPGLVGGSQDSGSDKVDTAPAASGAVTTGASDSGSGSASKPTDSKGAAAGALVPEFSFAPMVCGLVVLVSSLLGGSLIL
jgi:hypothetical protein